MKLQNDAQAEPLVQACLYGVSLHVCTWVSFRLHRIFRPAGRWLATPNSFKEWMRVWYVCAWCSVSHAWCIPDVPSGLYSCLTPVFLEPSSESLLQWGIWSFQPYLTEEEPPLLTRKSCQTVRYLPLIYSHYKRMKEYGQICLVICDWWRIRQLAGVKELIYCFTLLKNVTGFLIKLIVIGRMVL